PGTIASGRRLPGSPEVLSVEVSLMSTRKRTAVFSLALALSVLSVSPLAQSALAAEKTAAPLASTGNEAPGYSKEITSQKKVLDGKSYHVGSVKIHSAPDEVWSILTDYDRAIAV